MAEKKQNEEFATRQKEAPDSTAVEEKLQRQEEGRLTPVVQASDVSTLTPEPGDSVGEEQVQARIDAEEEVGLRGIEVDPTPNENYTVQGVVQGAPTPETDPDLREDIVRARRIDGPSPLR